MSILGHETNNGNRLKVIGEVLKIKNKRSGLCRCECGTEKFFRLSNIMKKKGGTKSCGCLAKERLHPMVGSKVYRSWAGIKNRCLNKKIPSYSDYGGRGIGMCEEWKFFLNFYKDMGDPPEGDYSIDRIDNDKGYSKENCRWATYKEQNLNRRSGVFITFNGTTLSTTQWDDKLGGARGLVRKRLRMGWDIEKAVTTSPKLYLERLLHCVRETPAK